MRPTTDSETVLLDALYRSALFDADSQQAIERLLGLVSNALGVPVVILSIGDCTRYVLRGHESGGVATEDSLAAFAPLIARAHGRSTFVATESLAPGVRGTFGATPLVVAGSQQSLGTLAFFDVQPREDSAAIATLLAGLATELLDQLRLRVENAARRDKEAHLESQKRVFGLIASGAPIEGILNSLASYVEHQSVGTLCVIHLLDEDNLLRVRGAPTIPESLLTLIDGVPPAADGCVSAQAAYRGEAVMIADVSAAATESPLFAAMYAEGIQSGWSFPIRSNGAVCGTVDLYRMNVGGPTQDDLHLISVATSVARIAIDRRRAEEQLRASEIYHRALIENSSELILVLEADGSARYVSGRVARAVGHEPHRIQSLADIVLPDDRPYADTLLRDLIETGEREFELRLLASDGSVRHILGTGTNLLQDAAVRALVINARDVTQQRLASAALEESEERYRLIARASSDLIWEWDAVQDVLTWPAEDELRFGYDHAELPSTVAAWRMQLHPEDQERVERSFDAMLRGDAETWSEEYRFQQEDGTFATVLDRAFVVRAADGSPFRLIGSMMDLTARRALEEQLRQSQRMEAVGRLAGGVAHDFNNLLTVIEGFTSLLLDELGADGDHGAALIEIQKASTRAATLTRQLLAFSRRQVLQPRLIDINEVVSGLGGMLRRLIPADIRLDSTLVEDGAVLRADVGQLEQVIVNLVINAREAIHDGGAITISTGSIELSREHLRRHRGVRPGQYVRLSVEDTGCGMDADVVSKIFEPFFTTKQSGTGLGLATVYGIIEQSGGHIDVHSTVGAGSRFDVFLPLAAEEGIASAPETVERGSAVGSEVIFVVEDDRAVRELTCRLLARHGYDVHSAEDGATALEMIRSGVVYPDLLLTDVVLPQLKGPAVAERVLELVPDVVVVFMSGYTDEQIGQHGILSLDVAFLQKPFQPTKLLKMVREQLDARAADLSLVAAAGQK